MRYLTGNEETEALYYIHRAAEIAKDSDCYRSKCGSIIVKENKIIGQGFNGWPKGMKLEKCIKDSLPFEFRSDKTCCVHAEQRAIIDACKRNAGLVEGARLYFIRLDLENNILKAGEPYCTICSKLSLDSGLAEFVLWHDEGVCAYGSVEYNRLSFEHAK